MLNLSLSQHMANIWDITSLWIVLDMNQTSEKPSVLHWNARRGQLIKRRLEGDNYFVFSVCCVILGWYTSCEILIFRLKYLGIIDETLVGPMPAVSEILNSNRCFHDASIKPGEDFIDLTPCIFLSIHSTNKIIFDLHKMLVWIWTTIAERKMNISARKFIYFTHI